jgi:hypothetical protein
MTRIMPERSRQAMRSCGGHRTTTGRAPVLAGVLFVISPSRTSGAGGAGADESRSTVATWRALITDPLGTPSLR